MTQPAAQDVNTVKSPLEQLGDALLPEMTNVNTIIISRMKSDVPMIPELAGYLIAAGGKRIRPLLTLACASLCGDKTENPHKLAAAVEFIHTATLLHDDVVDGSDQRRGKPTANAVFGNQSSVLVGDFLFARAFELMVETGNIHALNSLARASAIITEGEILQLSLLGDLNITCTQYFKIIEAKTAALFTAACEVAPILQNKMTKPFATFGHGLGMAFQIIDDVMDYTSPKMGKNKGDDFLEGKITLPVIIAMEDANTTDKQTIQSMMQDPSIHNLDDFIALLVKYDAFEQSVTIARQYSDDAANSIINLNIQSDISDCLVSLPHSILGRSV